MTKEWIQEKCNTNMPPTSVPERPSIGNKKHRVAYKYKVKKSEYYKDIIKYIDLRCRLEAAHIELDNADGEFEAKYQIECAHEVEVLSAKIKEWLNEEVHIDL